LRTLNILDTSHEERFDRVNNDDGSKRMFKCLISLVSLVDEGRQWLSPRRALKATENARDISFWWAMQLIKEGLFIIPDAIKDERFFDNPLVTEAPNIRFYAGYTLTF